MFHSASSPTWLIPAVLTAIKSEPSYAKRDIVRNEPMLLSSMGIQSTLAVIVDQRSDVRWRSHVVGIVDPGLEDFTGLVQTLLVTNGAG